MKQLKISSEEEFDLIDSTEGNIFFKEHKNNRLVLDIWGLTFLPGLVGEDLYIADHSTVEFNEVKYIFLRYWLYENECTEYKKDEDGNEIVYRREWGDKNNIEECYECVLGGALGKNVAFGELFIYCKGKVEVQYNEKAAINAKEYVKNASKYQYKC